MRRSKPTTLGLGSVSCATMREEDLIPYFLYAAENLQLTADERSAVRDIAKRSQAEGYYDSEDASYDLNERLFDILSNHVPAYCYFGSHTGDGADYGVWLQEGFPDDCDFNGLKVNDTSEVPEGYIGEVLVVNDHSNMTLYVQGRNGRRSEVWSIV